MAKVKFDVSGSDPERAMRGGEPPKPGVYPVKIKEINSGFSKGDDGKPDRKRPRLEVVFEISAGEHKGFPLWEYLTFTEASQWKLDQFLQTVGIADKKKRKGEFDTDEYVGQELKVRVKHETQQGSDEPRPRVAAMMPLGEGDDLTSVEERDDKSPEEDEVDLEALGIEADAEGDDSEAAAKLEDIAEPLGIDVNDHDTWSDVVVAIQAAQVGDGTTDDGGGDAAGGDGEDEVDFVALGSQADDDGDVEAQATLTEHAEKNGMDPDDYPTWAELATALAEAAGTSPF